MEIFQTILRNKQKQIQLYIRSSLLFLLRCYGNRSPASFLPAKLNKNCKLISIKNSSRYQWQENYEGETLGENREVKWGENYKLNSEFIRTLGSSQGEINWWQLTTNAIRNLLNISGNIEDSKETLVFMIAVDQGAVCGCHRSRGHL